MLLSRSHTFSWSFFIQRNSWICCFGHSPPWLGRSQSKESITKRNNLNTSSLCTGCSTIILLHSTNQIIDLWRCRWRWRCRRQILNSLILTWSRSLHEQRIEFPRGTARTKIIFNIAQFPLKVSTVMLKCVFGNLQVASRGGKKS